MAESRVGVFAIYNVEPILSSPSTVGPRTGGQGTGRVGREGEQQRGRVENALTASERANERASLADTGPCRVAG